MGLSLNDYMWLLYALGAFLMFGITNFLLKVASVKGVPSIEGVLVLWVATGLIGLIALIIALVNGRLNPITNPTIVGLDFKYLIIPLLAGITLAAGMYFLKSAVALGKAGPSTAVAASNAALVALLSWLLLNERLTLSEFIGMALYMLAIVFLALKPLG